jgi:hypothetical protein
MTVLRKWDMNKTGLVKTFCHEYNILTPPNLITQVTEHNLADSMNVYL